MTIPMQSSKPYKRGLVLLLALVLCLLPLLPAQAEAAPYGNATIHGVNGFGNLRKSASTHAAVVAQLPNGTRVQAQWNMNGWYYVELGGLKGYVADYLVQLDSAAPSAIAFVRTTNGGRVNVRQAASDAAKVVGSLPTGTQVSVLKPGASWTLVRTGSVQGYVASRFLVAEYRPEPGKPDPAPVAFKGEIAGLRTGSTVNLREQPLLKARVLGGLKNGQPVDVIAEIAGFYRVKALGVTGYVACAYVRPMTVPNPRPVPPVVVDPETTPVVIPVQPVPPVVVDPETTPVVIPVQPVPPVVVDPETTPVIIPVRPVPPIAE